MVVGALGPYSSGDPKPCRETRSSARSSLIVSIQAWPEALHDSLASDPISGS